MGISMLSLLFLHFINIYLLLPHLKTGDIMKQAYQNNTPAQNNTAGHVGILPIFTVTLFLSAFLLFSVQPMFTKMVLPRLGGSPGVWSVAMVFFQTCLLLGYAYAHVLTTYLSHRLSALVHGLVLILAFVALPLSIPEGWTKAPDTGQSLWLIGLFALSVGLPFFAVSANGPLLQAWFARSEHKHAEDPYFLYGASNIGSFASLILYIIFLEPQFTLTTQGLLWSGGFFLLTLLIILCAFLTWNKTALVRQIGTANEQLILARPTWADRLKWVALAFVPSGLMVAVTAHISTDVAAAPFLWVVPLALFLLTFVLAFQQKQWFPEHILRHLLPVFAMFVLVALYFSFSMPLMVQLIVHIGFFFIAALYCHTRMADTRPSSVYLTEFYMYMSLGGVLGGLFASLIALSLFDSIFEYPVLIVASLLTLRQIYTENRRVMLRELGLALAASALLIGLWKFADFSIASNQFSIALIVILFAAVSLIIRYRNQTLAAACSIMILPFAYIFPSIGSNLLSERTFFGITSVSSSDDGQFNLMRHGTTLHGAQRMRDEAGNLLTGKPEPVTYYHNSGPLARSFFASKALHNGTVPQVAIVGLGTGSMLCHGSEGEHWSTYEIDKSVVEVASNPKFFNYISDCGINPNIVVGDAVLLWWMNQKVSLIT
ncbi:MAG: hypothetical protein U5K75_10575 [Ahrensia sp.]|nr:hypothetical protein [Ahrensia sp.]